MIVNAGIEGKDYEKTLQLIDQELQHIQAGDFSTEEIEVAKKLLRNSLINAQDDPPGLIALSFNRDIVHKKESNNEYLERLMQITKEDIVKVANRVRLDTIFFLTGGKQ